MMFDPEVQQRLEIDGTLYQFAGNPSAPAIPYGQEGKAAIVYKLESKKDPCALKVFKPRFRVPSLVSLSSRLAAFADLPGLTVCRRSILTSRNNNALLRQYSDLSYACLMPWISGPTWMDILLSQSPLTIEQSHKLTHSFASILSELEQQGIAHCDLSAPNLILPMLVEGKRTDSPIELVDVEQIYARNLDEPEFVPIGTDGYAHHSIREEKIWNALADRFSGSILLAEMLGWCDPVICKSAWGDSSYFDQNELQKQSLRYDRLLGSLQRNWGEKVAELLSRAWTSDLLADCPTFDEWLLSLPDKACEKRVVFQAGDISQAPDCFRPDSPFSALMTLASNLAFNNNLSGALETLNQALKVSSSQIEQDQVKRKKHEIEISLQGISINTPIEPETKADEHLITNIPANEIKSETYENLASNGQFLKIFKKLIRIVTKETSRRRLQKTETKANFGENPPIPTYVYIFIVWIIIKIMLNTLYPMYTALTSGVEITSDFYGLIIYGVIYQSLMAFSGYKVIKMRKSGVILYLFLIGMDELITLVMNNRVRFALIDFIFIVIHLVNLRKYS